MDEKRTETERDDQGRRDSLPHRSASFFRYYTMGFQFCVTVVLGVVGGWWLEERSDQGGLWVIAGGVLGLVVAFYTLLRDIRR